MVGDYMFHRDPTKEKKVQYSIRKLFSILELKRTALTGQLTTTGRLTTHAREWNTICFCWSVEQQQAFKVLGSRDGYEEGTNNARILVEGWVATWRESWTSAEFHLFHFFFFRHGLWIFMFVFTPSRQVFSSVFLFIWMRLKWGSCAAPSWSNDHPGRSHCLWEMP